MKLRLDEQFVNLRGEPISVKMDDTLANMLAMSTVGNPAKMITWAVNLTNDGEIEVDKADLKFLKGFIEQNPAATNLVKSQLLERIEKLEEAKSQTEVNHNPTEDIAKDLMRQVNKLT